MPIIKPRLISADKPQKPYPDFPLFAHATKRWAKKIRGKLHYFGPWSNPNGAIEKYQQQRDDLYAGRTPRPNAEGLTVRDLVNRFLTSKQLLVRSGDLTQRSFNDYHETCERIVTAFGRDRLVLDLAADDFETLRARMAETRGPVSLGNEINRVRVVFKYAFDVGLTDRPTRYGPGFKKPSRKLIRKARNERGPRMFEPSDLRAMLAKAPVHIKAMILLGVNCGFGNQDLGMLPLKALDMDGGWVNYPRPKTEITRRAPLWSETIKALKAAIKDRPVPKDSNDANQVFLTQHGNRWAKDNRASPLSRAFTTVAKEAGIERPGLSFYTLRHVFETIGGEARDQAAVDHIMGHAPHGNDMSAVYRERMTDERLKVVSNHVRQWLFGRKKTKTPR